MTLVSSCAHASINLSPIMDEDMLQPHAHSMRSFSLREIQEAMVGIQEEEEKGKVYVAVGTKEVHEWIENMKWLLKNIDKDLITIVFLHVHQPAQKIATPIGYMPANGLEQQELIAYRQLEKEKMNKCLKKYVDICVNNNFSAIALSTDSDDIAKGLLELIRQYNVTDLVMGAGSARSFSILPNLKPNRENKPNSRIAIALREKAERSCRIRFISRGELICIREPRQNASESSNFSRSSSGSSSSDRSVQLQLRSHSMPPSQTPSKQTIRPSGLLDQKSRSVNVVSGAASFSNGSLHPSSYYNGFENLYSQSSCSSSDRNLVSELDTCNYAEDVYTRLEEAMNEAEKHKREAYEESTRRSKAELDLLQAKKQIRTAENMLNVEMQKKSEIEGTFASQSIELENTRKMYEQALNELSSLKLQNMQLRQTLASLESKIKETSTENAQEQDVALRTTQEITYAEIMKCPKFTYTEIKEATKNFDPSCKIGEGGFGTVYMGFLRHTRVAIKIMHRASVQGDPQFYQEIEILSQIRHPHLVMLIGACVEARALIYEYLELGSLDKHLTYNNQNRSLPWQIQARIALEICSALIFLHSSHVVHGDLKPENILLDSNCTVKLSDMGICRHVHMTNTTSTPYHITEQPRGTLPYMDPEYLSSGELTPQYDVYSFGIVLLQLVTGREAKRLKNDVEEAVEQRRIERMVDAAAGWPLDQAIKMIRVGLCCSDASRRKRPDLAKDVWRLLESIVSVASASPSQRRSLAKTA